MSTVVKVNDVSMMFNLSSEKIDSIKEYFVKAMRHELHFQEFWALKNVSFELEKDLEWFTILCGICFSNVSFLQSVSSHKEFEVKLIL